VKTKSRKNKTTQKLNQTKVRPRRK